MRNPYLGAKSIYHYTSAEGLLGILNGEWWATEAHYLNDPTELSHGLEGFEDFVNHSELPDAKRKNIVDSVREEYLELYRNNKEQEMFVISFSYQKDSPLMWSEFPGNSGYCLGFDKRAILASFDYIKYELIAVGDVEYIDYGDYAHDSSAVYYWALENKLEIDGDHSALEALAEREEGLFRCDCREIAKALFMSGALVKNECFSREYEYRLIFSQKYKQEETQDNINDISFRVRGNVIIPFIKIPCDIANSLIDIHVGPIGDFEFARRGLQRLLDSREIKVPIEQSSIPLRF